MARISQIKGRTLKGRTLILAAPKGGLEPAVLPIKAAGGGPATITGTLAATDGTDIAAFAGDIGHVGILTATDGADTTAIIGDVAHVGAFHATDSADTTAFSGDVCHVGTLSSVDGGDTFAATGSVIPAGVTITGDLAATDVADTVAATGDIAHTGPLAATDGADAFSGAGDIAHVGSLSATDGEDAAVFVGDNCHVGALAVSEEPDTITAIGEVQPASHAGGPIIWIDYGASARKVKRRKDRKHVPLWEEMEAIYESLIPVAQPVVLHEVVAEFVEQEAQPEASLSRIIIPAPQIDWRALARDMETVMRLIELHKQEIERELEEEEMLLLVA